jgi:serine/threonine-protein kinase
MEEWKILHYQIERQLGVGQCGYVYLATDLRNNQKVVIKEIRGIDTTLGNRFINNIYDLLIMNNERIAKIYAGFQENENLYFVMEYIEGENLEQFIGREGAIEQEKALYFMCEMLECLEYLHKRNIIHWDVKPSNIMIKPDGHICFLDTGFTKCLRNNNERIVGGMIDLTYMSPEQINDWCLDPRSNIYSLGYVLFYMLTGRHAFLKQESDYQTCVILENPKAQLYNPNISDNMQRIIDRATSENILHRFQSCREFEQELNSKEAFAKKCDATPQSAHSTPQSHTPTPQPTVYESKPATGRSIAIYIFAVLGGLLGIALGILIYNDKVQFADGKKTSRYKQSHRTAALIGAILSCVSIIIWITVINN